jgi:hypothetical protein
LNLSKTRGRRGSRRFGADSAIAFRSLAGMRSLFSLGQAAAFLTVIAAGLSGLRAQVTETPETMGPGRVALRMDAVSVGLARDTAAPNQYRMVAVGTSLVSIGITSTLDFEGGAQLYVRNNYSLAGSEQRESGVGAITLRPKWTFWNDPASGQKAAIIPFVILPTHSAAIGSDSLQGGIILPWSLDLVAGTAAGAMVEVDCLRNATDTRYDTRLYGSAFVKWELGQWLGAYAEATLSESTAGTSSSVGTVGGGVTLSVSKNFRWDYELSKVIGGGRNAWTHTLRFKWLLL